MPTKILVSFNLTGKFKPDDVTARLGLSPTKTWLAGDSIGKSTLAYKFDGWSIGTGEVATIDLESLIKTILALIDDKAHAIKLLNQEMELDAELSCAIYVEDDRPILWLGREVIARIAAIGASLDIDCYGQ